MNLERVNEERGEELSLPVGSILLSQMEYVIEVLMKFEPSLQLKTRTTPENQESFVSLRHTPVTMRSKSISSHSMPLHSTTSLQTKSKSLAQSSTITQIRFQSTFQH